MKSTYHPFVHRFAVFTVCWTVLLLVAGALVTSNDAALSVTDWPRSHGVWIPATLAGGDLYEYSHRVVAGALGIFTLILAVLVWVKDERRWLRWFAVIALGGIVAQAIPIGVFAPRGGGRAWDIHADPCGAGLGEGRAPLAALVRGHRARRNRGAGDSWRAGRNSVAALLAAGNPRVLRADYVRRDLEYRGVYEQLVGVRAAASGGQSFAGSSLHRAD